MDEYPLRPPPCTGAKSQVDPKPVADFAVCYRQREGVRPYFPEPRCSSPLHVHQTRTPLHKGCRLAALHGLAIGSEPPVLESAKRLGGTCRICPTGIPGGSDQFDFVGAHNEQMCTLRQQLLRSRMLPWTGRRPPGMTPTRDIVSFADRHHMAVAVPTLREGRIGTAAAAMSMVWKQFDGQRVRTNADCTPGIVHELSAAADTSRAVEFELLRPSLKSNGTAETGGTARRTGGLWRDHEV